MTLSLFSFCLAQAVGEPPFFMAASAFFAIKDAVASAREDHGESSYFPLNSPASSERSVLSVLTYHRDSMQVLTLSPGLGLRNPIGVFTLPLYCSWSRECLFGSVLARGRYAVPRCRLLTLSRASEVQTSASFR